VLEVEFPTPPMRGTGNKTNVVTLFILQKVDDITVKMTCSNRPNESVSSSQGKD
jgi:hypothetical protein